MACESYDKVLTDWIILNSRESMCNAPFMSRIMESLWSENYYFYNKDVLMCMFSYGILLAYSIDTNLGEYSFDLKKL